MVQQSSHGKSPRRPPNAGPPQRTAARVQRRSLSVLGIVGYVALGLVCLVAAGVSFLFIAAPVDLVRDRLVDEVKARTGRDLVITGPVSMALLPTAGVTMRGVALSAPPGQAGTTLTVEHVSAEVGLADLLSRRVQIRRLVLTQPQLNLTIDKSGRRSWDFAALLPAQPVRYAQARGPVMRDAPSGVAGAIDARRALDALSQVLPGELRVASGTVRYVDERTGENLEVTGIDLDVGANGVSTPLAAKGQFVLRGQPLAYTARLASLEAALTTGRADLDIKADGAPLNASFEGSVGLRQGTPEVDGSLNFKSGSVAALGLWLGRPMALAGPGDLALSSRVGLSRGQLTLTNFEGALAGKPARGSIAIDFNGLRPKATGNVDLAALDLDAVLLRDASDTPPQSAPQAPSRGPKGDPIGDLLRREDQPKSPQVRGFKQRQGGDRDWSDARLDTRLLALADADLRLSVQEIAHRELKTGPSRVNVSLADRNLRLDLEDITLYGGRGRGVAVIDAAAATPELTVNLNLDGVSAGPFLKDAAGFEWLEGRTSISVSLAGQGFSEREVVETLSGTVEIKTNNGNIAGINLPKVIRSMEMGQIPALQVQPSEKTAFSEFAGQFVIAKGIAQNNDLRLYTQNARINGVGTVNLPRRHLDYNVRAKVSGTGASPQQGAVVNFANIEIPLRVEGPWERPNIAIKGQEQILEGLKQIGKNLKNPEVQDALKGLLGGNSDGRVKPRELIEKLLKKE